MKVSVVTPSFNQGQFIARTLRSVAIQDGASIEHVVFDGGSSDETVSVLQQHGTTVRWVSRKDRGQTDAVNQGICATDGEIIGWLNSDDVYYAGAIAHVVEAFRHHPEVDVVYGMADHIDLDDRPFESYPTEAWNFERLMDTCFICQPALFMRRRVVERWGLLDEDLHYCMDYEYWLRIGKAGARFHYLPVKLAGSRLYQDNKTLGARRKVHAEINTMFQRKFGRVPDRWLFNYAHVLQDEAGRQRGSFGQLTHLTVDALLASLRWNHGVSLSMCRTIGAWFGRRLRASP